MATEKHYTAVLHIHEVVKTTTAPTYRNGESRDVTQKDSAEVLALTLRDEDLNALVSRLATTMIQAVPNNKLTALDPKTSRDLGVF
jgi:hypothetical protein